MCSSDLSYPFILAPDGQVISHSDAKLIGKLNVFKEMDYGAQMAGAQRGRLEVDSLGDQKIIIFDKSPKIGWVVCTAVNKEAAFADARSLGWLILILSGGQALVLVAGLWIILSVNVLRPIHFLVGASQRIAEGDLDTALDADRKDEVGSLQRAMSRMVGNLKAKIGEAEEKERIAAQETKKANAAMAEADESRKKADRARAEGMLQAADQLEGVVAAVTSASEEIARQIGQSSQGSKEQADRVSSTATAMEEMNATVMEVAKNAAKAAEMAEGAGKNAGEGEKVVARVIESIGEVQIKALDLKTDMTMLGEQVQGIGQVMDVISDIADQTNLLALNAAIEAARAGEAGRGFAVVADEVRKLAEKTMNATKEVGQSITGIQQGTRKNVENVDQAVARIGEATGLAGKSGEALRAIVTLVNQTTDQVRSIATAAEEQSATTEEINRSVTDISRIAAETAEVLSRSSQSLAELADQTRMLREVIDDMQSEAGGDRRTFAGSGRALSGGK